MKRVLFLGLLLAFSCTKSRQVGSGGCSTAGEVDCRPPMAVPSLDGSQLTDETLGGKIVLVNFWATWCKPCARELPDLEAVYKRHAEQGLVIVGLVSGDQAADDEVFNFAAARGVTYPLARSTPDLEQRFGMGSVLPMSLLYDRSGKLAQRWNGSITDEILEKKVQELLAR